MACGNSWDSFAGFFRITGTVLFLGKEFGPISGSESDKCSLPGVV